MRKKLSFNLIAITVFSALIFSLGCKRTEITETPNTPPTTNPIGNVVNDATQVTASVSGIVLDENNAPIANAVVTSGTANTTTNSNGMFIFQNISLSKENGNITAVKSGYFKGVRSFKTTEGKNHSVRLQLMQRTLSGTVNAAAGGTINANGGATIVFPANAFVTSAGATYTGTVNIYNRWIDPTAANLPFVIPGDLRGVSTTGVENILETYGMVGAELTDANGNALKIAPGKTATIRFPIPASLNATAPASIALWHFDEATARWKENGTATKTGSSYTAQVDKFSFWNVDVPNTNFINLDYTLINATNNNPLVSTTTRIKRVSNGSYGYGITNNAGFVSGLVPRNEPLVLEVTAHGACGLVTYSQNIGPFSNNASLGNISLTIPPTQILNFTGTLLNCTGGPVTNGYVSLSISGGYGGYAALNANGAFNLSIIYCGGNSFNYTYQGTDYSTSQQSSVSNGTASTGSVVNLGGLVACGASAGEDIYVGTEYYLGGLWKNGIRSFNAEVVKSVFVVDNDVYATGQATSNGGPIVWKNGIATALSTSNGVARTNSIFVTGTDVYCVGEERPNIIGSSYFARLWKNGVQNLLSIPSPIWSNLGTNASSVFIQGLDVYVAGNTSDGVFGTTIAGFWKNGVFTSLNNGTGNKAKANSIFVFNNDVYVAGTLKETQNGPSRAVYWKNGVPVFLTTTEGEATSIYVSQGDVYVAGRRDLSGGMYYFMYWKNGIPTTLMTTPEGYYNQTVKSIFVKNNNVYATGFYILNGGIRPIVWKNGVDMNFFNQNISTIPNSIFVK
jgi:hypothetical protein